MAYRRRRENTPSSARSRMQCVALSLRFARSRGDPRSEGVAVDRGERRAAALTALVDAHRIATALVRSPHDVREPTPLALGQCSRRIGRHVDGASKTPAKKSTPGVRSYPVHTKPCRIPPGSTTTHGPDDSDGPSSSDDSNGSDRSNGSDTSNHDGRKATGIAIDGKHRTSAPQRMIRLSLAVPPATDRICCAVYPPPFQRTTATRPPSRPRPTPLTFLVGPRGPPTPSVTT